MKSHAAKKIWQFITILVAWYGLGLQLYILLTRMAPLAAIWRFLLFYTILTNLLIAISLTTILLSPGSRAGRFFAKSSTHTAITIYIFIVALIYNLVLRAIFPLQGWDKVANEILHVIVPLLFIVHWFVFVPKGTLKWKIVGGWLIYPALYLIYALVRGKTEDFYAYPFINISELGATRVALNCVGVSVAFLVTCYLFIGIDKWMGKRKA